MFSALIAKFNLNRFFVGEGPQQEPYLLTQRRVYILPTQQGLVFTLLLFVMLLGSINYSNSLGYFLTFYLASLAVVAIFHTYNNILKLSIGHAICKPVFSGEEARFNIQVNNINHQPRFSVRAFTPQKLVTTSDLTENSLTSISIKHVFNKRGLISLPRFTIETRFPFGLFRAWAIVEVDQKQLVYPKPSSHTVLPIKNTGSAEGQKQFETGTDDFKGLRSYTEGDPLQHIHWKSFARHKIMQTKEFSSTTSDELWLNWSDTSGSGTELKLSQLTRWVLLADKAGLHYGLSLPNKNIKPGSGRHHLESCLKQLAMFDVHDSDVAGSVK